MNKDTTKKTEQSVAEPKKARRELLGSGAMAAASMMFGLVAAACSDDDDSSVDAGKGDAGGGGAIDGGIGLDAAIGDGGGGDAAVGAGTDKDIDSLNALLKAEYLAITAYTAGAGLIAKAPSSDPYFSLGTPITQIAVAIQTQHKAHAKALVDAIVSLNGTPVVEATVAATLAPPALLLSNPTIANILKFAAGAERSAAVSYNQVLAGLQAARFRFLATIIEGDETQHFIVLAALVLGLAAPGGALAANTSKVFPADFVHSFAGSQSGLDKAPPNYFA